MNGLTEFERHLLETVAKGKGKEKWSWHDIGIRVAYTGRVGEGNMLEILKGLEQKGLVKRHIWTGSPEDRWELTEKGEQILTPNE